MNAHAHRALALAGIAGGACWITMAAVGLLTPAEDGAERKVLEGTAEYVGFGSFAAALALTICALVALHRHQQGADGPLGRAGVLIAITGCAGQCVVISTIVVTGEEPSWFGVAAPLAIATWFFGSVAFGIALRRARVMPGWVGTILPVVTLLAIVGSEGGTSLLIGVFLIGVGARLARAAAAQTARPLATAPTGA